MGLIDLYFDCFNFYANYLGDFSDNFDEKHTNEMFYDVMC